MAKASAFYMVHVLVDGAWRSARFTGGADGRKSARGAARRAIRRGADAALIALRDPANDDRDALRADDAVTNAYDALVDRERALRDKRRLDPTSADARALIARAIPTTRDDAADDAPSA